MKIRKALAAATALAVTGGLASFAAPAHAADTAVTFTVNAGALSIASGANAALSNATATVGGTSVSGALGSTTVTDNRAALAGSWTVTGSSTDFADGTKSIAKGQAAVYSGVATASTGTVVFVPTVVASPVSMAGTGGTIASATGVLGASSVTYNPTMAVTIPTTAQAGSYSATFTQTVA